MRSSSTKAVWVLTLLAVFFASGCTTDFTLRRDTRYVVRVRVDDSWSANGLVVRNDRDDRLRRIGASDTEIVFAAGYGGGCTKTHGILGIPLWTEDEPYYPRAFFVEQIEDGVATARVHVAVDPQVDPTCRTREWRVILDGAAPDVF